MDDEKVKRIINELRVRDDTATCIAEIVALGPLSELVVYEALVAIRDKTDIPLRVLDPMYKAERAMQMAQAQPWPDKNKSGRPMSTYNNFNHLCKTFNITLYENLLTHECDILLNGAKISEQDLIELAIKQGLVGYKNTIASVTKRLAGGNKPYHPVARWLEGREWDGEDRIEKLIYKLNLQQCPDDLARIYLTRWLLGGIECVYNSKGTSRQSMLVLQGKSGCGKTMFFESLTPQIHENEWFGNAGRTPWDARLYRNNTKKWLLEFASFQEYLVHGHVVGGRRTNLTDVSLFLDKHKDSFSAAEYSDRRMFFCAGITTKEERIAYAADRHYMVLPMGELKFNLSVNARQLWLQIKQLYDDGQRHILLDEELKKHMRYANVISTRPQWTEEKQRKNSTWLKK